ncbi:hypothetical protein [Exiguobacterium sp. BG5(2022)]|uniref:hypothetical protein n=1 Tax=Exiguobacterium sp. BG5(2022) TaxID=2962595 RepID=UPI002881E140|nr:hypothetical protein [Exiguobacterium sp. BG5(2022)]MDT0193671.1 hypothetical protein [Exiguobacterium sp. BG5(2022)]
MNLFSMLNGLVFGSPFTKLNKLVTGITTDVKTLVVSIFILAILILGSLVAFGNEENVPRFKKGLIWSIAGLSVTLLASIIVSYVQKKLA